MATEEMGLAHERRIVISQSLYALAVIPSFIVNNTYVSITLIVLFARWISRFLRPATRRS